MNNDKVLYMKHLKKKIEAAFRDPTHCVLDTHFVGENMRGK